MSIMHKINQWMKLSSNITRVPSDSVRILRDMAEKKAQTAHELRASGSPELQDAAVKKECEETELRRLADELEWMSEES